MNKFKKEKKRIQKAKVKNSCGSKNVDDMGTKKTANPMVRKIENKALKIIQTAKTTIR